MLAQSKTDVCRAARAAFSLLELLLVIVILAILAGLTAAGLQKVRVAAAKSDCQNRMRNQVQAVFAYEARVGRLPPGSISGPFPLLNVPDEINHGFWTVLLGELDQPAAATLYRWDLNYDDAINQPVVGAKLNVLLCPGLPPDRIENWSDNRTARVSDYAPVEVNPFLADIGAVDHAEQFDGPLPVNGTVRLNEITDGAANTLLLAEAAGRPGMAWSSPDLPVSVRFIQGSKTHGGGANAAMCDGSVRFLGSHVDVKLLAKLATRSGNENFEGDW